MGVSYTYSHWMQATEYLNPTDADPSKMISDLDVPHRLSLNGIYQLPFGKGKRFGSDAGAFLNGLIGDWQIQGVYTYQKGFPVPFGTDGFYQGGDLSVDQGTTQRWFNTDQITSVLNSTSTNASPLNHLRSASFPLRFENVRRDAINTADLSLLKDVRFQGGTRAQFRLEFINAFNQTYFPNPQIGPTGNTFGQITSSNQSNYARRVQIGIKFLF